MYEYIERGHGLSFKRLDDHELVLSGACSDPINANVGF